jgi:alpha-1,2-glucosyltransferase
MLLGLASVHFNTIVHPFTRADNRHYVFYVFRILMRHWAIKYAAVPVYYVCGWLVLQTLSTPSKDETQNSKQKRTDARTATTDTDREPVQASFVLVWLATTALSVVSAPLVEPRYFIIPWIMWRLHVPSISGTAPTSPSEGKKSAYDMRLAVETVWHVTINIVTGYLFFYKGFTWPSEPGKVQRFMW